MAIRKIKIKNGMFQYFLYFDSSKFDSSSKLKLQFDRPGCKQNTLDHLGILCKNTGNGGPVHELHMKKRVAFNLKPTIHRMHVWQFAYTQARRDKWEQIARDHARFQGRINALSKMISKILLGEKRKNKLPINGNFAFPPQSHL